LSGLERLPVIVVVIGALPDVRAIVPERSMPEPCNWTNLVSDAVSEKVPPDAIVPASEIWGRAVSELVSLAGPVAFAVSPME